MKVFVILSIIAAVAVAHPSGFLAYSNGLVNPVYRSVIPAAISSQYHSQDELGQYSYVYSDGLSAKSELKTIDGVTRGGYSYVDADGVVQSVQYTSDAVNGFQVAATNLPVAPKAAPVEAVEAPKPVEDTPEVAEAKVQHLAAVEEAKVRNAAVGDSDDESVEVGDVATVSALPASTSLVVPSIAAVRYAAPLVQYARYAPVAPLSYSYGVSHPAYSYSVGSPVYYV